MPLTSYTAAAAGVELLQDVCNSRFSAGIRDLLSLQKEVRVWLRSRSGSPVAIAR